jgi:hypothetical protein
MSDTVIAALIGGVAGSIVTGIIGFVGVHLQRRSDERHHRQQLIMQAAIEHWKVQADACLKTGMVCPPIHTYMLYAVRMMDVFELGNLDATTAKAHMRDLDAFVEAMDAELNRKDDKPAA